MQISAGSVVVENVKKNALLLLGDQREEKLEDSAKNAFAAHRLSIKYKIIDDLNLDVSTVYFDPTDLQKGSGMYFQNKSRITANLTYYY